MQQGVNYCLLPIILCTLVIIITISIYYGYKVYTYYRNCNIDAVDSLHHTALHIAARRNHTSAVKILLAKGADMQLKDDNGDQPIHIAAETGNYE